jgi:phosphatidate cytidylyltransferase
VSAPLPLLAAAPRVGVVLLAGVLGLLAARHRGDIAVLVARLRTWAVIAVVWFAVLAVPGWGPAALGVLLAGVGALEYGRLVALPRPDRRVLAAAAAALPAAAAVGGSWAAVMAVGLLAATAPVLLAGDVERGWDRIGRSATGVVWLGGGASAVAVLPAPALLAVGLAVALADVGGFTGGALAGRRRLSPRLSPGKTVEGLVGAALGASAGLLLVHDLVGLPLLAVAPLGTAAAVCATWGDLLESLVKRTAGCKDAGSWLPGFGGLLDRADSLLVTAPVWWAATALAG